MQTPDTLALTQELIARASVTPTDNGCQDLVLIGAVRRPSFLDLRPDAEGAKLIGRIGRAAFAPAHVAFANVRARNVFARNVRLPLMRKSPQFGFRFRPRQPLIEWSPRRGP